MENIIDLNWKFYSIKEENNIGADQTADCSVHTLNACL